MSDVSVIIPTYNRRKSIAAAIISVLEQSYPVKEIIVCDDGSTDDTKILIDKLNNKKVLWIDCGRNGGPAIPRNIGISIAKGDWIAFLDSDDTWEKDKIERQLDAAKKNSCFAVCSNATRVLSDSNEKQEPYFSLNSGFIYFQELINTNKIICSSAIIHKSLFRHQISFPESIDFIALEDYALWLKVATITNWYYLQNPLVNYLDNPSESIRSNSKTEKDQKLIIFSEYLDWNNKKFPLNYKILKSEYHKITNKSTLISRIKLALKSLMNRIIRN